MPHFWGDDRIYCGLCGEVVDDSEAVEIGGEGYHEECAQSVEAADQQFESVLTAETEAKSNGNYVGPILPPRACDVKKGEESWEATVVCTS